MGDMPSIFWFFEKEIHKVCLLILLTEMNVIFKYRNKLSEVLITFLQICYLVFTILIHNFNNLKTPP